MDNKSNIEFTTGKKTEDENKHSDKVSTETGAANNYVTQNACDGNLDDKASSNYAAPGCSKWEENLKNKDEIDEKAVVSNGVNENDDQGSSANNDEDESDNKIITIGEYIKEQEEMEEESFALLGSSDDKNCSYPKGYLKRQALYACITCNDVSKQLAGVCYACSAACHDGHELVELRTKRNFRCDCGNNKFPKNPCKLYPFKDGANDLNTYNQNYKGLYCFCSEPYDVNGPSMVQCVTCEDWFHTIHLIPNDIDPDDFTEVICQSCASKLAFFAAYEEFMVMTDKNTEKDDKKDAELGMQVDEPSKNGIKIDCADFGDELKDGTVVKTDKEQDKNDAKLEDVGTRVDGPFQQGSTVDILNSAAKLKKKTCLLTNTGWNEKEMKSTIFWKVDDWRKKLCRCESCAIMYSEKGVPFLTDEQDTIEEYTRCGKLKQEQSHKDVDEVFNSMPHVTKIALVEGYMKFKNSLKDYLKKFVDNNKVIRDEDLKEFFEQLEQNKRRKTSQVQHFCR